MRRFRFKLETVLRHRAIIERQRQQALAEVQNEMAACEVRLSAHLAEHGRTAKGGSGYLDMQDIAQREVYLAVLDARIAQEERIREGIAARLTDARTALLSARQARESIERVRLRHAEEHLYLTARAEQADLDEAGTLRHGKANQ